MMDHAIGDRSRVVRRRFSLAEWLHAAARWLPVGRTLSERAWWDRHRAILVLLWLHAVAIPVYAVMRGFGLGHGLLESLPVAVPAAVATMSRFRRNIRTWAAAVGILSSSAVLVHLSNGLIEMHFHFFVMVAVVALYQDWVPFLLAVGYVFVHHGLMGAIDPRAVYNHPAAVASPWTWAGIHALFISGISAVCLVTWRLNETALTMRRRAEEENARLYEAEREARASAEAARTRLSLLAEASRVMASSLDLDVTLRNVARLSVPAFADLCVVDVLEPDGSLRRVASITEPTSDVTARELERHVTDPSLQASLVMRAMRSARPIMLEQTTQELIASLGYGGDGPDTRSPSPTSAIIVPLRGRSDALGALSFATTTASERRFGADDMSLAEELARRAAISVENARQYAHERDVAETLQRSLLPATLPSIPGVATAVRYVPAGDGNEVGGDWYDSFVLPGSKVGIVMGDVIGRGIPAASLMGQLRNAVRAHALDGLAPVEVVSKLNRLMQGSDPHSSLATLIFVVLDPADGSIRIVNAGHPPPLILRANGSARFGPEGLAIPLGVFSHATYHETTDNLAPGDTLVLYTDGLVESRELTLEQGLENLRVAALEAPDDLEGLADYVFGGNLRGRQVGDDAALLAVRQLVLGDRVHVRVSSDPRFIGAIRSMLRRWLDQYPVTPDEVFDVLCAAGEACTNAIEHAQGPGAAVFDVDASVHDGGITLVVRDHGRWRPSPRGQGGNGLVIMRELMDEVAVERREDGTEVRLHKRLSSLRRSA